jgi:uncharacterized membrane protein YdjX (TVP38/TMEM64 family)
MEKFNLWGISMKFRSNIMKSLLKSILSIVLIAILILLANKFKLTDNLNFGTIVKRVSKNRKYDELYFLIICSLRPILVVVPSSIVSIAGGTLFGPIKGFILNMLGFFLSGTIAFYISRLLGKEFIDRIIKGKVLQFDNGLEKNGFKIIFLFRFPPIFHYDIFSFAAGLTKVKYKDYIAGSLLGVIPETICYSYMGQELGEPVTYKLFLIVSVIIAITIITTFIFIKDKHIKSMNKDM